MLVVVANTGLLVLTMWKLRQHKSKVSGMKEKQKKGSVLRARTIFGLTYLLGVTWLVGVALLAQGDDPHVATQYIFTFLNIIQGIVIFVFQLLLSPDVRASARRAATTSVQKWRTSERRTAEEVSSRKSERRVGTKSTLDKTATLSTTFTVQSREHVDVSFRPKSFVLDLDSPQGSVNAGAMELATLVGPRGSVKSRDEPASPTSVIMSNDGVDRMSSLPRGSDQQRAFLMAGNDVERTSSLPRKKEQQLAYLSSLDVPTDDHVPYMTSSVPNTPIPARHILAPSPLWSQTTPTPSVRGSSDQQTSITNRSQPPEARSQAQSIVLVNSGALAETSLSQSEQTRPAGQTSDSSLPRPANDGSALGEPSTEIAPTTDANEVENTEFVVSATAIPGYEEPVTKGRRASYTLSTEPETEEIQIPQPLNARTTSDSAMKHQTSATRSIPELVYTEPTPLTQRASSQANVAPDPTTPREQESREDVTTKTAATTQQQDGENGEPLYSQPLPRSQRSSYRSKSGAKNTDNRVDDDVQEVPAPVPERSADMHDIPAPAQDPSSDAKMLPEQDVNRAPELPPRSPSIKSPHRPIKGTAPEVQSTPAESVVYAEIVPQKQPAADQAEPAKHTADANPDDSIVYQQVVELESGELLVVPPDLNAAGQAIAGRSADNRNVPIESGDPAKKDSPLLVNGHASNAHSPGRAASAKRQAMGNARQVTMVDENGMVEDETFSL